MALDRGDDFKVDETQHVGWEAGADVYAGDAVTTNGSGQVVPVSANGSDVVVGVAYEDGASGDDVVVVHRGGVVAQVETDASAGDTVGTHDGSAENVEAGQLSVNGEEYVVKELNPTGQLDRSGTAQDYAKVVRR
jgi:hypothetical protein